MTDQHIYPGDDLQAAIRDSKGWRLLLHRGRYGTGLTTFTVPHEVEIVGVDSWALGLGAWINGVFDATGASNVRLRNLQLAQTPLLRTWAGYLAGLHKHAVIATMPGFEITHCDIANGLLNVSWFGLGDGLVYGNNFRTPGALDNAWYDIYMHKHLEESDLRVLENNIWGPPIIDYDPGVIAVHMYSEGSNNIRGVRFTKNILLGSFICDNGLDIYDVEITDNYAYGSLSMRVGRNNPTVDRREIKFTGNTIVTGYPKFDTPFILYNPSLCEVSGNRVITQKQAGYAGVDMVYLKTNVGHSQTMDFHSNEYHHIGAFLVDGFSVDDASKTWAEWQAAYGEAGSTYDTTAPTAAEVHCIPNRLKDGANPWMGNIVVYNFLGESVVSGDLTGLGLLAGRRYRLVNSDNPDQTLVFNGDSSAAVSIPMEVWSNAVPVGGGTPMPKSSYGQSFLVEDITPSPSMMPMVDGAAQTYSVRGTTQRRILPGDPLPTKRRYRPYRATKVLRSK